MNDIKYILSAVAVLMSMAMPVPMMAQQGNDSADSIVFMGYSKQPRRNVSSAISTVSGSELEKTPSVQLSQTFEGSIAGLSTIETNSRLGKSIVSMYSRGINTVNDTAPIIIIDGIIDENGQYDFITAQEIESVTLLKDAAALAIYGLQSANGVIVITTKTGCRNALNVSVKIDETMQSQYERPYQYDSYEYAAMRRQAWINDGTSGEAPYTEAQIASLKTGKDPLYPNNDWYGYFVKPFSQLQRVGINVSGGGKNATYFSNVNISRQGSVFDTDPEQTKYDAAPNDFNLNFRTKVDIAITDKVNAYVNVSGSLQFDNLASSGKDDGDIYASLFNLPSTMAGPKNSDGQITTMENVEYPTYGLLNASGFTQDVKLYSCSNLGVRYRFDGLLEGLSLYAAAAFQTADDRYNYSSQDYARYYYDYATGSWLKRGSNIQTNISNSTSSTYGFYSSYYCGADYTKRFGEYGKADANLYSRFVENNPSYSNPDVPATGMTYYSHNIGLAVNYSYKDTYLVSANLGVSGSDAFAREHRYTPVPALSVAWVISNEPFMAGTKLFSNLKLRASAGYMANDQFSIGDYRWMYSDYITTRGNILLKGNPDLEPEKIFEANAGFDAELFKDFSVSLDAFYSRTDNMLIDDNSSTPAYQGLPLSSFSKTNDGRMHNCGLEASLQYSHRIDSDWSCWFGGSVTASGNEVEYDGELELPGGDGEYAYTHHVEGYPYGQQWGYLIDRSNGSGYITTDEELSKYSEMYSSGGIGTARKGDFIYKDLNGDGLIDKRDLAPIGHGAIPELYYTLKAGLSWKNFELSLLFQGVSGYSGSVGYYTDTDSYGIYSSIHQYAWTSERASAGETIKYPALSYSTKSVSELDNDFNITDRSYLRLKNVTLTYTLPHKLSETVHLSTTKIYLNCQNAFTISALAGKDIDPEVATFSALKPYRLINLGLKLDF
jgi:TonB-linked SusC/RagA family outer membrane protein